MLSLLALPPAVADTLQVAITLDLVTVGGAPLISAATTVDQDGDGQIDHLVVDFTQTMTISDPNGAVDGLPCLTLDGGYRIAPGSYAATAVRSLTLALIPSGSPDTGVRIAPTYRGASGSDIVSSSVSLAIPDGTTIAGSDGAKPVLISAVTRDSNADGLADAVLLRWSEAYAPATLSAADLTVGGQVPVATVSTLGGSAAGPDGVFAVLGTPLAGDASPVVASQAGRLRDPSGNLALAVRPVSGDFVSDTLLTYQLTEACAAGAITWTRVGGADDLQVHTSVLSAGELALGSHGPGTLTRPPTLVPGAVYDLAFTLADAAGNGLTRLVSSGVTYFSQAGWPRIVSEATLAVAAGGGWTYDVVADLRGRREGPPTHRPVGEATDLVFALGGTVPTGMTLERTGATSARVTWPNAAGAEHVRVRVVVTDRISGNGDLQDILIYVVPSPAGGG